MRVPQIEAARSAEWARIMYPATPTRLGDCFNPRAKPVELSVIGSPAGPFELLGSKPYFARPLCLRGWKTRLLYFPLRNTTGNSC